MNTIFLAGSLIEPDLGLAFWTVLFFVILWIVLGKFGFSPIAKALKERETSIEESLASAENARKEMQELSARNEEILQEAKAERSNILKEANKVKDEIIAEARNEAQKSAAKIMADTKEDIEVQKKAVMADMKNAAAELSVSIAEKVLSRELSDKGAQEKFINEMADNANLN